MPSRALVLALLAMLAAVAAAAPAQADTVTISGAAPAPTRSTSPQTFNFSGGLLRSFTCSYSNSTGQSSSEGCSSSFSTPTLATGTHTVTVTDDEGGSDSRTFIVDTQPPTAPVFEMPAVVNTNPIELVFSGAGPGDTYECKMNVGPFLPCTSPHPVTAIGDQTFAFTVRTKDALDTGPSVLRWVRFDATKPVVQLTFPSNLGVLSAPQITFASPDGGLAFTCALDSGAAAPCASPYTPPSLAVGDHTLAVAATDEAGNQGDANVLRWAYRPQSGSGGFDSSGRPITSGPGSSHKPSADAPLINPFPIVRIAGDLFRGMARISLLSVTGPKSVRIRVTCRGRGCPRSSGGAARPRGKTSRVGWLRGARLRKGAVLAVRVTQPGHTGKYTRFVVRGGRPPRRTDLCLPPGANAQPVACPS
jgi:hypothetical protein